MSFQALSLLQVTLAVAATAGVIVFLYWLKPPPQRVIVPSTLIWARVLKERKRRSDFWRWLVSLLIALVIGLAIASAIGEPEVEALSGRARRIAIVIDNSPTMATETATGQSRWDVAVTRASELLNEGSVASEYLLTDTGGQLPGTGFTSRARALELLDGLTPVLRNRVFFPEGDPSLTGDGDTEVYFISDGVLIQEVPPHVTTISVFEPADNVGITAFDLRPVPAEPTRYEGFLELSNHGRGEVRVALQIDGAGGASVQNAVSLAPGEVLGESLNVDNFLAGPIRVLIDAPGDALTLDNVAYTYLAAPRRVQATLVTRWKPVPRDALGARPPGRARDDCADGLSSSRKLRGRTRHLHLRSIRAGRDAGGAGTLVPTPVGRVASRADRRGDDRAVARRCSERARAVAARLARGRRRRECRRRRPR